MLLHVKKNSCSPIKNITYKKRILHYLDVPADSRKCEAFGNTATIVKLNLVVKPRIVQY